MASEFGQRKDKKIVNNFTTPSQKRNIYPTQIYSQQKVQLNRQQKLMQHFESINQTQLKYENSKFYHSKADQQNYQTKIQSLNPVKNHTSIVNRVLETVESSHLHKMHNDQFLRFKQRPNMLPLETKIKNKVMKINDFFNGQSNSLSNHFISNQSDSSSVQIMSMENYAIVLLQELRQNSQNENLHKILNNPTKQRQVQVNTEPINSRQNPQTLRKIDIILMEIMMEKKRKGFVSDYLKIMELKLTELLDYILIDQSAYHGMNLSQKMKQVLKNLESFKGKMIDGELKVNLLRIFFEEFRNIKNESVNQKNMLKYSIQSQSNPPHNIIDSKKTEINSLNKINKPGKVKQNTYEVMSVKNDKRLTSDKSGNKKIAKSVKNSDQWIGQL